MAVLYSSGSGIAYPGDMETLKRIFDDLCAEKGISHSSPAAEDLARATMDLFAQGVFDEVEIRESLQQFLSRRSSAN